MSKLCGLQITRTRSPPLSQTPCSTFGFFRNSAQGPSASCSNFLQTTSQQMSLLAVSRRAAWRVAPRSTRSVVVDAGPKEWTVKREAIKHHAKGAPCPPGSPEADDLPNSFQTPPTSGARSASMAVSLQASDILPVQKARFKLTRTK